MELYNVSKTMFIPLYGKAEISKRNIFLKDIKAEEIVSKIDFDFKSLKQSKWLSLYMSVRSLMIDELCNDYLDNNDDVTVIHLGCGLDSRCLRVNQKYSIWYDIDYEEVIKLRNEYYDEDDKYKMICSSVSDLSWINKIDKHQNILIVMEGLTMYLNADEIKSLIDGIENNFSNVHLIFDAYTKKAVRYSKYKNPVNKFGAKIKYGIDKYEEFLLLNDNLRFVNSYYIRKTDENFRGFEKFIFDKVYCGKIAEKLYKIYEFEL